MSGAQTPGAGALVAGPELAGPALAVARLDGPHVLLAEVTEQQISSERCADLVAAESAGAVVTFAGVVRDHDEGRAVVALEYEAHPSATEVLERTVRAVAARHDVHAVAVAHRIGPLLVGDCALAVAVSAAHRRAAFAAAADLVDEVKRDLPVWKRQVFSDGTDEWIACP